MRHSKYIRIAGAVFGLTLAACGSELEGQPPTPDTADTSIEPDTDTVDPDVDTTDPDTTEPDTEVTEPDADAIDPDADAIDPDADATDPDADATDPDADATDPDADATDPDADATDPDADATDPDTDVVTPPTGESCDDPRVITAPSPFNAPVEVTGDTTGKANDHAVAELACPGMPFENGGEAGDEAWTFTAPTTGVYRFSLVSGSGDVGFYILQTCEATATCLGGSDFEGTGDEGLDERLVRLDAGQTVFVIVDGYEGSEGSYTLAIAPPAPFAPGDTCAEAIPLVANGPNWVATGDTTALNLTDAFDVGECGPDFTYTGAVSPDQVFSFTAPTAGTWTATLSSDATADLMLYGYLDACNGTCAGAVDDGLAGDDEVLELPALTAGQTVYLVVDSWAPFEGGAFTLTVASACTPTCDLETCGGDDGCGGTCGCGPGEGCLDGSCQAAGETCADPIPLTAGAGDTWTAQGNLVGRANDVSGYVTTLACPLTGFSSNGNRPDEVFSFTAPTTGPYDISTLGANDEVDVLFAVFEGTDCATGACLGFVDNNLNETSPDTATFNLTEGTTYLIVVDSYSESALGAYTVSVAPQCVPACAAGACNVGDGCGGTCACGVGEQCTANVCEPVPSLLGDSCLNPFIATGDGFSATFDTCTMADDFRRLSSALNCEGTSTVAGNNRDAIIKFNSPTAGRFTVRSSATSWDGTLNVIDGSAGCPLNGNLAECIDGHDDPEPLALTFDAAAGQDYFIIVDAWFAECGTTTVTISEVCLPQCSAGACGIDDGCGGTCGCSAGSTCDQPNAPEAGTCIDTPGETCAAALPLVEGPTGTWTGAGTLTGAFDNHARGACPQLGSGTPTGTGSVDQFWSFTPTETGLHKIDLARGTVGDIWFTIYEGAGCSNSGEAANCRGYYQRETGTNVETLTLSLTAGTLYTIAVEAASSFTTLGTYNLSVTKVCDPVCTDGLCGVDNGCGGTCGCAAGEQCTDSECVPLLGDSCASPFIATGVTATTPYTLTVDSCSFTDDVKALAPTGSDCASNLGSSTGRDFIVAFTPPEAGTYTVTATQPLDLILNVVTGACPAGDFNTCAAEGDDNGTTSLMSVTLANATPDQTYYIVVDQWGSPSCSAPADSTLTITKLCIPECTGRACDEDNGCGQPCGCTSGICQDSQCVEAEANSCATAGDFVLSQGIYTATGDIRGPGITDTFRTNGCTAFETGGYVPSATTASRDQVFAFTAPETNDYFVTLTPTTNTDIYFQLNAGLDCAGATCAGVQDKGGSGVAETATVQLLAGQTYWIVVDSWTTANTNPHPFTLTIQPDCTPAADECDGQACDFVTSCGTICGCQPGFACEDSLCEEIPRLPFDICETAGTLVEGTPAEFDTCLLTADYDFSAATCMEPTTAAKDGVVSFVAPSAGNYLFEVEGDGAHDVVLNYVITEVGDCPELAVECTGGVDEYYETADEFFTVELDEGEVLHLFVTGYLDPGYSNDCGAVAVHVQKLQAEICDDGLDNDMNGQVDCADAACAALPACAAQQGASCGNPFQLAANEDSSVWTGAGTLVGATDNHNRGTCPQLASNSFTPTGAGTADNVWAFTTTEAAPYTIDLLRGAVGDLFFYVYSAQSCTNDVCLGYVERVAAGTESQTFDLAAATTYYIVVDSYAAATTLGEYTLTVTRQCAPQCTTGACGMDDGCGGTCGCGAGEICDDGTCAAVPGDACDAPFVATGIADATPYNLSVDLCTYAANHSATSGTACSTNSGTAGRDFVVEFTPPEAGTYTVTANQPVDLIMNIVEGACPGTSYNTCRAGIDAGTSGTMSLTLTDVTPEQTFYIVVDQWGAPACTTAQTVNFAITKQCVSTGCDGACNTTDNCGNACNCGGDSACTTSGEEGPGICEALELPEGDACADPIEVANVAYDAPYALTIDTCTMTDSIRPVSGGGCATVSTGATAGGGKDLYLAFTPEESGVYRVQWTETNADLVVNVVAGQCPTSAPTSCVAGSDSSGINVTATAGTTYYIHVDGWTGAECGSTDLTITRIRPPLEVIEGCPADYCVMTAGAGPNGGDLYRYTIPAAERPTANDFSAPAGCSGYGTGADLLVILPAGNAAHVTANTCTTTPADSSLAVYSTDPRQASPTVLGCNGDATGAGFGTAGAYCSKVGNPPSGSTLSAPPVPTATQGASSVYVVVDDFGTSWWTSNVNRVFEIELIAPAAPETDCADGVDNDGDGQTDCNDSDCAAAANCQAPVVETDCADGIDNDGDGQTDCDDSDCAAAANCQPPPVETNCTDGIDNDGDGQTDCNDSDCAEAAACQAPVEGDSCAAPFELQTGESMLVGAGNLTGMADDFFTYEECPLIGDSYDPDGDLIDTPDQVFAFTVPTSGNYLITVAPVEGDMDFVWALYEGETCAEATCVGYVDITLEGQDELAPMNLTAGSTYYLVVDAWDDAPVNGEYQVFIELDEDTCVPTIECDGTRCDLDNGCGEPCTCGAGTTCNLETFVCEATQGCVATDLFFSEYIEGSSLNKALEIFNGTGADVDLSAYTLRKGSNGAAVGSTLALSGTLTAGDVWVLCNPSLNAEVRTEACDVVNGFIDHNGDDAYRLEKDSVVIDEFGTFGSDPGDGWAIGDTNNGTKDHTLVRKPGITSGTTDWAEGNLQWDIYPVDTFTHLGSHSMICEP